MRQSRSKTCVAGFGVNLRKHTELGHHEDAVNREMRYTFGLKRIYHHEHRLLPTRCMR